MTIFKPFDLFSNAVRAKEIISVLVRRGFGDLLAEIGIPKGWLAPLVEPETLRLNIWQRIRITLEELGPTFVKSGQVLSSRPDVLPDPLIKELKLLRSQVKAVPFDKVQPVLEKELGCDYHEKFSDFDTQPVACGSIGQVYQARLADTGEMVAVKVQRPNIRKAIKADIEIIGWIARLLHEKIEDLRPYDLPEVVESTGKGIMQELDFSIEANNANLFNLINPYKDKLFAPKVYMDFTGAGLCVMEWVDGVAPGDPSVSDDVGKQVAVIGGKSVFHQIVISGFFHADPHTGNILITKDGRACFIDWGLAGQLTREMRYFLADLFSAIASADPEKVVRVAMLMAVGKKRVDETQMEKEVAFVLRQYGQRFGQGEAIGNIVIELLYVFGQNGIQLARDYSLLAKAIVSIEEVGVTLDPTFDIRKIAQPFIRTLTRERWNPINIIQHNWLDFVNQLRRFKQLPNDLQRFFRNLEDGDISVKMNHEGMNKAGEYFDIGINRLVLGMIISALLIGSSLILAATLPIQASLHKFPTHLGSIGFFVALGFGLYLLYDIVRHGRHKKK